MQIQVSYLHRTSSKLCAAVKWRNEEKRISIEGLGHKFFSVNPHQFVMNADGEALKRKMLVCPFCEKEAQEYCNVHCGPDDNKCHKEVK